MDQDIKRMILNLQTDVDFTTSADVSGGFCNENLDESLMAHQAAASVLQDPEDPLMPRGSFEYVPLASSTPANG